MLPCAHRLDLKLVGSEEGVSLTFVDEHDVPLAELRLGLRAAVEMADEILQLALPADPRG
jgi:hypothetical protein